MDKTFFDDKMFVYLLLFSAGKDEKEVVVYRRQDKQFDFPFGVIATTDVGTDFADVNRKANGLFGINLANDRWRVVVADNTPEVFYGKGRGVVCVELMPEERSAVEKAAANTPAGFVPLSKALASAHTTEMSELLAKASTAALA